MARQTEVCTFFFWIWMNFIIWFANKYFQYCFFVRFLFEIIIFVAFFFSIFLHILIYIPIYIWICADPVSRMLQIKQKTTGNKKEEMVYWFRYSKLLHVTQVQFLILILLQVSNLDYFYFFLIFFLFFKFVRNFFVYIKR